MNKENISGGNTPLNKKLCRQVLADSGSSDGSLTLAQDAAVARKRRVVDDSTPDSSDGDSCQVESLEGAFSGLSIKKSDIILEADIASQYCDCVFTEDAARGCCSLPSGFSISSDCFKRLFEYQREGVAWMWNLCRCRSGGILADDMGLGKTFQVVSFLHGALRRAFGGAVAGQDDSRIREALLVIPKTVASQWRDECKRWLPVNTIVCLYEGTAVNRRLVLERIRRFGGVLLITYGMLSANAAELAEYSWGAVVLDEGHMIRNPTTQISRTVNRLSSSFRIVLSGTPLQNQLGELWALLDFATARAIRDKIGNKAAFKANFTDVINAGQDKNASAEKRRRADEATRHLWATLSPHFLRRTKEQVLKVVEQADKHTIASNFDDVGSARDRVAASAKRDDLPLEHSGCGTRAPRLDAVKQELVLWVRLSPCALRMYRKYLSSRDVRKALEHAQAKSNALASQTRHFAFTAIAQLRAICHHPLLFSRNDSDKNEARGGSGDSESTFDISCEYDEDRGGGLGAPYVEDVSRDDIDPGQFDYSGDTSDAPAETTRSEWDDVSSLVAASGKLACLLHLLRVLRAQGHRTLIFSEFKRMIDLIGRVLRDEGIPFLQIDGSLSQAEREKRMAAFRAAPPSSMNPARDREGVATGAEIENSSKSIPTRNRYSCMLLTKGVGAVGLNLTCADRVIIFEPSWNPSVDEQAVDRAYRMGQTKDVLVYRLVTASTIEEQMYKRLVFKVGIKNSVMDNSRSRVSFAREDLSTLFALGPPRYSNLHAELEQIFSISQLLSNTAHENSSNLSNRVEVLKKPVDSHILPDRIVAELRFMSSILSSMPLAGFSAHTQLCAGVGKCGERGTALGENSPAQLLGAIDLRTFKGRDKSIGKIRHIQSSKRTSVMHSGAGGGNGIKSTSPRAANDSWCFDGGVLEPQDRHELGLGATSLPSEPAPRPRAPAEFEPGVMSDDGNEDGDGDEKGNEVDYKDEMSNCCDNHKAESGDICFNLSDKFDGIVGEAPIGGNSNVELDEARSCSESDYASAVSQCLSLSNSSTDPQMSSTFQNLGDDEGCDIFDRNSIDTEYGTIGGVENEAQFEDRVSDGVDIGTRVWGGIKREHDNALAIEHFNWSNVDAVGQAVATGEQSLNEVSVAVEIQGVNEPACGQGSEDDSYREEASSCCGERSGAECEDACDVDEDSSVFLRSASAAADEHSVGSWDERVDDEDDVPLERSVDLAPWEHAGPWTSLSLRRQELRVRAQALAGELLQARNKPDTVVVARREMRAARDALARTASLRHRRWARVNSAWYPCTQHDVVPLSLAGALELGDELWHEAWEQLDEGVGRSLDGDRSFSAAMEDCGESDAQRRRCVVGSLAAWIQDENGSVVGVEIWRPESSKHFRLRGTELSAMTSSMVGGDDVCLGSVGIRWRHKHFVTWVDLSAREERATAGKTEDTISAEPPCLNYGQAGGADGGELYNSASLGEFDSPPKDQAADAFGSEASDISGGFVRDDDDESMLDEARSYGGAHSDNRCVDDAHDCSLGEAGAATGPLEENCIARRELAGAGNTAYVASDAGKIAAGQSLRGEGLGLEQLLQQSEDIFLCVTEEQDGADGGCSGCKHYTLLGGEACTDAQARPVLRCRCTLSLYERSRFNALVIGALEADQHGAVVRALDALMAALSLCDDSSEFKTVFEEYAVRVVRNAAT